MKVITKVGRGKVQHAASYNPFTGDIKLHCNSLKYQTYLAAISDPEQPTVKNVTCKKCLKNQREWLT